MLPPAVLLGRTVAALAVAAALCWAVWAASWKPAALGLLIGAAFWRGPGD